VELRDLRSYLYPSRSGDHLLQNVLARVEEAIWPRLYGGEEVDSANEAARYANRRCVLLLWRDILG
jgi:hypothetical protein